MTNHHLAAGDDLTRPITQAEFENLNALGLIAPCHSCTQLLVAATHEDDVVYHPNTSIDRHPDLIAEEIAQALAEKKH